MSRPRFHIEPGDVPAEVAARRLGLSEAQFREALPLLTKRGFPKPDETTGNFDLTAIDEWRKRRHPQLFLTAAPAARDARTINVLERLEGVSRGHGRAS